MTNEMCNDWLMQEKDQQVMTNAGYVKMEEAQQNVVMKEGKGSMLGEIAKGSDVMEYFETEAIEEDNGHKFHSTNSWMIEIFMTLCFVFAFVAGKVVCLIASQMKDEHKCFMKDEHKCFMKA